MTTSHTAILSDPVGDQKISIEALAYMRARAKRRAYDLVMSEFKRSGLSRAQLARRLFGDERRLDRVSRMLGGPGNWTLKTLSDLLWAIGGAEPNYSISYPLKKSRRNMTGYSKFLADLDETHSASAQSKITFDAPYKEETESGPMTVVTQPLNNEILAGSNTAIVKQLEAAQ